MEWKPVESSQIAEVGYDLETETLGIRFKASGKYPASEYHYSFVDSDTYYALMTAESIGKYFGATIKANPTVHPYTRVEQ